MEDKEICRHRADELYSVAGRLSSWLFETKEEEKKMLKLVREIVKVAEIYDEAAEGFEDPYEKELWAVYGKDK